MVTGVKYENRILRINLQSGTSKKEIFDPKETRKWIGGAGVGIKILYDEVPPEVKALAPENKIIFTAGPLNGTKINGTGIYNVSAKGPLTGKLVQSQANGFFGARMRHAGYETIIIENVADEWSYIYIEDDKVEIRPAKHLMGLDTFETEEKLKKELDKPKASVVCIGPAGENLIKFAALFNDHGHVASTNGPGCVMGSKKIKAIVVSASSSSVDIWDEDLNKGIRKEFLKSAENSYLGAMVKNLGTHGYYHPLSQMGNMLIKNYTTNEKPDVERWFGENLRKDTWDRKPEPCWACPFFHCSTVTIKDKKSKAYGYVGEEPEYENLAAWTMMIGNDDIGEGVRLANINERMGFDAKEMTFTVGLVMECFNDGIITLEDTGGIDLTWGNTDAVAQLLEDVAHLRGFGAKIAGGVKATAEMIGGEALNKAVYTGHGQATNVIDARGSALQFYLMNITDSGSFYSGGQQDPFYGNQDEVQMHDVNAVSKAAPNGAKRWVTNDTIGCCMFFLSGDPNPILAAVNAATGWDMTREEYVEVGHRITTINRAYNLLNGATAEAEMNPSPRMRSVPVDGPAKGYQAYSKQAYRDYYKSAGWDEKTSKPLPETLKKLGLEYIIKDLWDTDEI